MKKKKLKLSDYDWVPMLFIAVAFAIYLVSLSSMHADIANKPPLIQYAPYPTDECTNYHNVLDIYQQKLVDQGSSGGCYGIYRFYSGKSFMYDLENMIDSLPDGFGRSGKLVDENLVMNPPASSVLIGVDDSVCIDYGLWVYCLAAMYPNVACDVYYAHFRDSAHIGLDCVECIEGLCTSRRV
jgi:hypothetical protein